VKQIEKHNLIIKQIYQPLYKRKLSDKEVREIIHNLTAFVKAIIQIAQDMQKRSAIYTA